MTILDVDNINTYYGNSHVLHGISLEINEGEVVTLLGRNGAGKTTTMRSIVGASPPRTRIDHLPGRGDFRALPDEINELGSHSSRRTGGCFLL